jgi:UDP-3-O-[3-hydroxymyristoyl] glucosamine N-acyltransferase
MMNSAELCRMQLSAKELATLLNGSIEGNPDMLVGKPGKIEEAQPGDITFLGNDRYESFIYTTKASVVLVNRQFQPQRPLEATLIRVDDVYQSLALLLEKFGAPELLPDDTPHISAQASIHPQAQIGAGVSIGPFAVIEAGAVVGDGCRIEAQAYIGAKAVVGAGTKLYPGVRILHDCQIGANCILHANAVIGSDGFGFAPLPDGSYRKIAQIGNVIIEDNVEIGANTTVDRATMGSTVIRKGVKLDNLIQVGHNVEIGDNTVIAAQTGIAGSTKIGKNCRVGGQVGMVGHLRIADGTQIQAQTGVASHIEMPNTAICGYPAFPYRDFLRSHAVFKRLPDLDKKIKRLEERLKEE